MRTRSAELAGTRNLVIAGAAVTAIGVSMAVWETQAEQTLMLQALQEAPSIEGLSIVEVTKRGSERGKIMVSADGAFPTDKLLDAMIEGGDEEYTPFLDAVHPMGAQTIAQRTERMNDSFSHRFRTIDPEDCVGDHGEGPHRDNLRDMSRRYADVTDADADACIEYIEDWRRRNAA